MGVYDSVYAPCKQCGFALEWQSKAPDDCAMREYWHRDVPVVIAEDLNGESRECPECGEMHTLRWPEAERRVTMIVE